MYQPAIFATGYAGYRLFERTVPRQLAAFAGSIEVKRDIAYFKDSIADAVTPAKLIADRRLLKVALSAFGLGGEIDKRALIRRVLEEGVQSREALANRMSDPRWRAFAEAFGYGEGGGTRAGDPGFAQKISERYRDRAFEEAVGAKNEHFRLAMNFRREAAEIAAWPNADRIGWLRMLGQSPLRAVLEGALGLPRSFALLDVDRQVEIVKEKARAALGSSSPAALSDPDTMEKLIRRFFSRSELSSGGVSATLAGANSRLSSPTPSLLLLANAIESRS